jgi:hypothetical protein
MSQQFKNRKKTRLDLYPRAVGLNNRHFRLVSEKRCRCLKYNMHTVNDDIFFAA